MVSEMHLIALPRWHRFREMQSNRAVLSLCAARHTPCNSHSGRSSQNSWQRSGVYFRMLLLWEKLAWILPDRN